MDKMKMSKSVVCIYLHIWWPAAFCKTFQTPCWWFAFEMHLYAHFFFYSQTTHDYSNRKPTQFVYRIVWLWPIAKANESETIFKSSTTVRMGKNMSSLRANERTKKNLTGYNISTLYSYQKQHRTLQWNLICHFTIRSVRRYTHTTKIAQTDGCNMILFTRFGSAKIQSVFFRPIKFDTSPKIQLPSMAPIEKHDPIHDVSDNVIGPVSNGDSFDCNFGRFGLNHPIAIPWHRLITFAVLNTPKRKKKHIE